MEDGFLPVMAPDYFRRMMRKELIGSNKLIGDPILLGKNLCVVYFLCKNRKFFTTIKSILRNL